MTVDFEDLRDHIGDGPSDGDLTAALNAALEALDNRYGPASDTVTEYLRPFRQWVKLTRRAESVTSVREGDDILAGSAYGLWPGAGSRYIRRLGDDTRPTGWQDRTVEVSYTAQSEDAERDRVTYALCDLELARTFGLRGITVGPWAEQYQEVTGESTYEATREMILDSLRPATTGVW